MAATWFLLCMALSGGPAGDLPVATAQAPAVEQGEPGNRSELERQALRLGVFASGASLAAAPLLMTTAAAAWVLQGLLVAVVFSIDPGSSLETRASNWFFVSVLLTPGTLTMVPAAMLLFLSVPFAAGALLVGWTLPPRSARRGIIRRAGAAFASAALSAASVPIMVVASCGVAAGAVLLVAQPQKTTTPRTQRAAYRGAQLVTGAAVASLLGAGVLLGSALLLQAGMAWLQLDALEEPPAGGGAP